MKLSEHLPLDEFDCEHKDYILKHDKEVARKVYGCDFTFPFKPYRNCAIWFVFTDGTVFGWNESPRNGWGLKYLGHRAIKNFYSKYIYVDYPNELEKVF